MILGRAFPAPFVLDPSALHIAKAQHDDRLVQVRFGVAWIDRDRAVEISQRLLRPTAIDKNRAQVAEGGDVAGVDRKRLAKSRAGHFELPGLGEGAAEIAVGFSKVRLE